MSIPMQDNRRAQFSSPNKQPMDRPPRPDRGAGGGSPSGPNNNTSSPPSPGGSNGYGKPQPGVHSQHPARSTMEVKNLPTYQSAQVTKTASHNGGASHHGPPAWRQRPVKAESSPDDMQRPAFRPLPTPGAPGTTRSGPLPTAHGRPTPGSSPGATSNGSPTNGGGARRPPVRPAVRPARPERPPGRRKSMDFSEIHAQHAEESISVTPPPITSLAAEDVGTTGGGQMSAGLKSLWGKVQKVTGRGALDKSGGSNPTGSGLNRDESFSSMPVLPSGGTTPTPSSPRNLSVPRSFGSHPEVMALRDLPPESVAVPKEKKKGLRDRMDRVRDKFTSARGTSADPDPAPTSPNRIARSDSQDASSPTSSAGPSAPVVLVSNHGHGSLRGNATTPRQMIDPHGGGYATIPAPSPGSGSGRQESPFERRTKIATEILETERTYVGSITMLLEVYQQPLMATANEELGITPFKISCIFNTMPQLIPLNKEVLRRLEEVMSTWNEYSTIGDIFVEMAPFLKIYKDYENGYQKALETYTELLKEPTFAAAVELCDSDSRVNTRLESVLIMPVQRIPRYKILLEDLGKRTPETHADTPYLREALKKIDDVAIYIDENLKEYEQRQKLLELTVKSNANTLLKPHRKWLREGEINLRDPNLGNRVKKLHVLLFNDIIVPCVQSKLVVGGDNNKKDFLNRPENQWPLELLWIREVDPVIGKYMLELIGPGVTYFLKMNTQEEKDSWKRDIVDAMEKHTKGGANAAMGEKRIGGYAFKNTTVYRGEWLNGKVHGKGEMILYGSIYTGNFENDQKCGHGRMVYSTKEVYDGDWFENLPHGQGTMIYPTGDRYEGAWRAGMRHGFGVLKYGNGDVYDGYWEDNLPQGQGKFIGSNGLTYDGYFQAGEFNGRGTMKTKTGKMYDGDWVAGMRQGNGTLRHCLNNNPSLVVLDYSGEWFEDMRHGNGTLKTAEGTYNGQFVCNMKDGEGQMDYADGGSYVGSWKRDMRHGIGTYKAPATSGQRVKQYQGEWMNNKKHGRGELWLANGNQYEGTFKSDLPYGNGLMKSFVNGAKLEGKWVQGNRMGNARLTFKPNNDESRELVGVCKEPALEAKKVFYVLAPQLPDMHFSHMLE